MKKYLLVVMLFASVQHVFADDVLKVDVVGIRDSYMDPTDQAKLMENQDRARYYDTIYSQRPVPTSTPKPESCNANAIETKAQLCKRDAQTNFASKTTNCIAAGATVFAISTAAGAGLAIYMRDPSLSSKSQVLAGGAAAGSAVGAFLADYVRDSCKDYYSAKKDTEISQCDLDKAVKTEECAKYN